MPRLTKHSIPLRGNSEFKQELLPKSQVGKTSSYTIDLGDPAKAVGLYQECDVILETNPASGSKPASHYVTVRIYGAGTDATTNQQIKNGKMATVKVSAVIAPEFDENVRWFIVDLLDSLTAATSNIRDDWNSASVSELSPLTENILTNANQY